MSESAQSGKTALVTGASSGIGKAAAMQLAAAGYRVALVSRTLANLEKAADEIRRAHSGSDPLVIAGDVCDTAGCKGAVEKAHAAFGRLDVLLNVAGAAPLQPIKDITPEIWRNCVDANLTSTIMLTAAAWPIFERQQAGFVGNVSSLASFDPFPGFSIYAAAKAGVNMFTFATAQEGEAIGVKAVCVAPGAVETPMLRSLFDTSQLPADHTMPPDHVARVLTDCVLGKRTFTSGETIKVAK